MIEDYILKSTQGEQMSQEESIPKHIKYVDKRNQKQIDKFYEREILIMKDLRKARHEQSPFRHTIFN